jgi:hypothetical protein
MIVGGDENACPGVTSIVPSNWMSDIEMPENERVTVLESMAGTA